MSVPTATAFDPTAALDAASEGEEQDNQVTLGGQSSNSGGTIRAYVVATEVTTQQAADAQINDLARL